MEFLVYRICSARSCEKEPLESLSKPGVGPARDSDIHVAIVPHLEVRFTSEVEA